MGRNIRCTSSHDVLGEHTPHARLRDVWGFAEPRLTWLLEQLKEKAVRPSASGIRGLAQSLPVHLARE